MKFGKASSSSAAGKLHTGNPVKRSSTSAPSTSKHANSAYKGGKQSGAAASINKKK